MLQRDAPRPAQRLHLWLRLPGGSAESPPGPAAAGAARGHSRPGNAWWAPPPEPDGVPEHYVGDAVLGYNVERQPRELPGGRHGDHKVRLTASHDISLHARIPLALGTLSVAMHGQHLRDLLAYSVADTGATKCALLSCKPCAFPSTHPPGPSPSPRHLGHVQIPPCVFSCHARAASARPSDTGGSMAYKATRILARLSQQCTLTAATSAQPPPQKLPPQVLRLL